MNHESFFFSINPSESSWKLYTTKNGELKFMSLFYVGII